MIILKLIGYCLWYGFLGAVVFFGFGLYLEMETRPTERQVVYNHTKKEYSNEIVVVDEDISGNTVAYFTFAGWIVGVILGVIMVFGGDINQKPIINTTEIPPDSIENKTIE